MAQSPLSPRSVSGKTKKYLNFLCLRFNFFFSYFHCKKSKLDWWRFLSRLSMQLLLSVTPEKPQRNMPTINQHLSKISSILHIFIFPQPWKISRLKISTIFPLIPRRCRPDSATVCSAHINPLIFDCLLGVKWHFSEKHNWIKFIRAIAYFIVPMYHSNSNALSLAASVSAGSWYRADHDGMRKT